MFLWTTCRTRSFVIDDDPSMRGALEDLVSSVGLQVRAFASPQQFLESQRTRCPGLPGVRREIAWYERVDLSAGAH